MVGNVDDSAANATSCVSTAQSPEECNYRSAVAYCQQHLTAPLKYCTIHLPAYETLTMDPLLGGINLTEVAGYFKLVRGSICVLYFSLKRS
jgi:hypothetical protein